MAIDSRRPGMLAGEDAPVFLLAGTETDGEYYCASCGYGVAVRRMLPTCPMCGGSTWEPPTTSPFITR